jgi:hypothetical protein
MMDNWSIAISLMFPTQAHLVQGYLESEGIETIMKDEMTAQVNNMYSNAIGGVKIFVRDADLEKALRLLEQGGYITTEKTVKIETVKCDNYTNKSQCPFCRSENIGKSKSPDIIMLIASLIFGVIVPILRRTNICFDCRKEWRYVK